MKTILIAALILIGCGRGEENMDRWERLSRGQPLGKRIVIAVPPTGFGEPRPGTVDMLQISNGDDRVACQLAITLLPPQAISLSEFPGGVFPSAIQNVSGERYNASIYASPPPANYVAPPAVAVIRWGVGGIQSIAEVDFSNGMVINLTASFVRVSAFVDLPSESFPEGAAIVLGAFIGPGWPKPNNAQRTYNVLPLLPLGFPDFGYGPNGYLIAPPAGGLANLYPVPFFAKQVSIIASDPNVAPPGTANTLDANLIFYRDIFATIRAGSFRLTNDQSGPILVPNGAMYWSLQNNVAVSQNLSVIFDLTI